MNRRRDLPPQDLALESREPRSWNLRNVASALLKGGGALTLAGALLAGATDYAATRQKVVDQQTQLQAMQTDIREIRANVVELLRRTPPTSQPDQPGHSR